MVGVEGIEPSTKRLCVPLQLSLHLSVLWSGLSLHRTIIVGACHTVSTPFPFAWDLARDYHLKGFPDFDKIYLPVAR